ncbi:ADP-ribosylglycohydrolase family protein [Olsenella urininfantis]|uniref:ADP-ribosylglycohydrolase family protein n=1 Tax=Olsenella urininfantis TaxID=1871033 RepID=UPI00098497D9|nr:ADP-ribosylglycohydrolase family protein [Olsenella urininfantis]
MRAWEFERRIRDNQIPRVLANDNEVLWEEQATDVDDRLDAAVKIYWGSQVPGSLAREVLAVAAIQATENLGMKVENADRLLMDGFTAIASDDIVGLHRATHALYEGCRNAKVDPSSDYWKFGLYDSFEDYARAVSIPEPTSLDMGDDLLDRIHAGWMCQIIGGAYGTCVEGYTTDNIRKAYGNVEGYVRKPNTYNDDITYELALLVAYEGKGRETTNHDIAYEWMSRIGFGWSAEDMALRNLRCGIMPPESGRFNNPYREWIGAQMRGAICGQIYPGNPFMAAQAAFHDGEISHCHNGILGEVFNALLCSMAFYERDVRKLVEDAIALIPSDSQYHHVVSLALEQCRANDSWLDAWRPCEKELERYNWVHAYPNAAIEVIALWFGNGDFLRTLEICGGCGQDVDCVAAQVMTVWGTMFGFEAIPSYWVEPFGDRLDTYVRDMKVLSIRRLSERTAAVARSLAE